MAEVPHLEAFVHEVFIGRVLQKHSIFIIRCLKVTHPRVAPAEPGGADPYGLTMLASPHALHLVCTCNIT